MKKILIVMAALFVCAIDANAIEIAGQVETCAEPRSVVFRSTQRLRSRDGRSIYLYSSGRCELFDGDQLIVECTYTLQDGEVRLLDENGNTVYKGAYRLSSDRRNIASMSIAGTSYYAF